MYQNIKKQTVLCSKQTSCLAAAIHWMVARESIDDNFSSSG